MNIAIVGADIGSVDIIKAIKEIPNFNISIIVDSKLDSPGISLGKTLGIRCSSSIEDIKNYSPDIIIEASRNESLHDYYSNSSKIIDFNGAQLIVALSHKLSNQVDTIKNSSGIIQNQLKEISSSIENVDNISNELLISTQNSIKYIHESDKIIQYVNKIAHQTKILGINATIEASRAGEQGKGFAVVANEVQNLANNSQSFAQEINDILIKLSQETKKINVEVDKLKNLAKTQIDASNNADLAVNKLINQTH